MQGVSVVGLFLCIGAVCSQGDPPVPAGMPGGPTFTSNPASNRCYRQFGRYTMTNVHLSPQPYTMRNTRYFYHDCFYYKPSYSRCTGECSSRSYQHFDTETYKITNVKTCRCCKATRYQIVPVKQVYCRYIVAYNGCAPPTITSGWVYTPSRLTRPAHPAISRLRFYVVDGCTCSTCDEPRAMASPRSRVDPDVPEEFQGLPGQNVGSEAEVQGLEPPPNMMPNTASRAGFGICPQGPPGPAGAPAPGK